MQVSPEIFERFPQYNATVGVVSNISGQPSDEVSNQILISAEDFIKNKIADLPLDEFAEVTTWREAFSSFGVKPRVARSSVEALARRAEAGLPRINWLTDVYNAISVKHLLPIGGENFDKYVGAPILKFASGAEAFDTMANGELINESPEPGEVIWADEIGATCRRWNWRQCVRTRLDLDTTQALFIFDGLDQDSSIRMEAAATELFSLIASKWPESSVNYRKVSL